MLTVVNCKNKLNSCDLQANMDHLLDSTLTEIIMLSPSAFGRKRWDKYTINCSHKGILACVFVV